MFNFFGGLVLLARSQLDNLCSTKLISLIIGPSELLDPRYSWNSDGLPRLGDLRKIGVFLQKKSKYLNVLECRREAL